MNNKHETYHLKYATTNIKYEYPCNSEHTTSNMKHRIANMKLESKHETGAKKKNFGVFEKLLHETLHNQHETDHLKYTITNIKYESLRNSEHET